MILQNISLSLIELGGELPGFSAVVSLQELSSIAQQIKKNHGQLLTLWGSDERRLNQGFKLHLIFIFWQEGLLYLQCALDAENPSYPDLSQLFPVADRLQRSLYDLLGIKAEGAADDRPWLRHGAWPANIFPLRNDVRQHEQFINEQDHYTFVRVVGEGVHEIPVGPVHAGIIEPGHFRFQVVGERILRLEERLGYIHKGVAKQFQGLTFNQGTKLAGHLSGDSTVAYAWSYCMAIEHLYAFKPPPRALWLRALLLERERIMNHIGDLGALGNDAGLGFGLAQFSRLKEDMLRLNAETFGHRYLMDVISLGGIHINLSQSAINKLQHEIVTLAKEISTLRTIYTEHDGLQDRFLTTGIVSPELAKQLGLLGMAARASSQRIDLRLQLAYSPYNDPNLSIQSNVETEGDVAARVRIRFREIEESLQLMNHILYKLPEGDIKKTLSSPLIGSRVGLGCVEGWRGPVFFAVCNEDSERIRFAHAHDPSWQNWPALEYAVIDNIVPDFPLINKSFNLSYSGCDG